MANQAMIYERAVPVSEGRHAKWGVAAGADFSFSSRLNSVPLTTAEFQAAAPEYVIVFAGTRDMVTPAVMLGLREGENLYLAADGSWKGRYVPAFLRRYPFVFSSVDEGKSFTLCIDESGKCVSREGGGQLLYEEGQPSKYTQGVLRFLERYQAEFQRTQEFCRSLLTLGLLEPMRAQATLNTGERVALGGFMAVDRQRLKALPVDKLVELTASDEMELLYAHLLSLRNFRPLLERLQPAPRP